MIIYLNVNFGESINLASRCNFIKRRMIKFHYFDYKTNYFRKCKNLHLNFIIIFYDLLSIFIHFLMLKISFRIFMFFSHKLSFLIRNKNHTCFLYFIKNFRNIKKLFHAYLYKVLSFKIKIFFI